MPLSHIHIHQLQVEEPERLRSQTLLRMCLLQSLHVRLRAVFLTSLCLLFK